MQITDILRPEGVRLRQTVPDKAAAIHTMVGLLYGCGVLSDAAVFEADVLAREQESTTGLGEGLAIPHAKSSAARAPGLVAMTLREDLDFAALDGAPVRLLFMIAAPQDANEIHLRLLSKLAMLLMDHSFCEKLMTAETTEQFLHLIAVRERAEDADKAAHAAPPANTPQYQLLAVTSCPMGIAHTYMAAEALNNKAKELHITLKVETDGATGCENTLSPGEIAAAQCIIVAADRAVEIKRFAGKPLLRVPVSEALRQPEALLRRALADPAPVYTPTVDAPEEKPPQPSLKKRRKERRLRLKTAVPHKIYAHLMSGISHMLPFVTGGGILIALSYLFDRTNIGMADFGSGTTLAWLIRTMGEIAMNTVYPVLAGYIAVSIGDLPALLPGVMGGYLAEIGMTTRPQGDWVSAGFWGALIAGFAAGFIIRTLRRGLQWMPGTLKQIKTSLLYPVFSLVLVGVLMIFVVNPPVGQFNAHLYQMLNELDSGSAILLGAVLAGLMAVDFGGPINKAAYLFATVALTEGRTDIMSATMLGGMVPSIGVAIACSVFHNQFTRKERQTAFGNYLLGASFVTEGALPFALRDPLRVIPPCIAGSALAGGLSIALGCAVPAPHGGLFLLPLIENRCGFLAALAAGSVMTALLMGFLRMKWPQPAEEPAPTEEPAAPPTETAAGK